MDALNIGENLRNNVKFIIEENGNVEVLPTAITHSKLSSLLNADTVIYISEDDLINETALRSNSDMNGNNRRVIPYSPT